jgi:hypothetical protein
LLPGLDKSPSSLTFFPFQLIFSVQISAQRRAAVSLHPSGETIAFSVFTVKQSEAASPGTRTALGGVTGNGVSPEPWAEAKKCVGRRFFSEEIIFFRPPSCFGQFVFVFLCFVSFAPVTHCKI